ncbi:MAG: carboxypeptidase regulatory-like domain-containing protein [Archangium sp.]
MLRLIVAATVLSSAAFAQPAVTSSGPSKSPGWTDEAAQVRLHYGASIRNGVEDDGGPGLTYSGVTPNDLAGTAWLWFLLGDHLGVTGSFAREAFSLIHQGTVVTQGGLIRFSLGPTGRVRLGPVRLEAAVSYAFHQIPVFGTVNTPSFTPAPRHGILLAARGLVDLGPVTLEGRFEATPGLAQPTVAATSLGFGAGGGVRVQLFRTGFLKWGLLAEALWQTDGLTGAALTARQSVVRVGGAIDVQWKDPALEKAVTTGALSFTVRGENGPLSGAVVTVDVGATHRTLTTDAQGKGELLDLEPGEVTASATLAGYERGESKAALAVGETRAVELVLNKEKPKVGGLVVRIFNFDGKVAVANATVELNGTANKSDASGSASFAGLAPGPVSVKVTAPGFTPGEEAASIVAGTNAELVVTLVPEKKRVPATLSGQVRSARGGKPVAAQLEIKELKQSIACEQGGTFSVQIPGGKYTVRITAQGFVTQTKAVSVQDGDQAIFNIDLAPK